MKIISLLEAQYETKIKTAYAKSNRRNITSNIPQFKKIGKGYDSSAITNTIKNSHTIWKLSNSFKKTPDGFNTYISYIIENNLQDNPHFPRVYNIRNIKNSFNENVYAFETEKLISYRDIDHTEFPSILERNFSAVAIQSYDDGFTYPDIISEILYNAIEHRSYKNIINDSLVEACQIIHEISSQPISYINKFGNNTEIYPRLDVHRGNIMYRRGKYGVELVINDPLVFDRD